MYSPKYYWVYVSATQTAPIHTYPYLNTLHSKAQNTQQTSVCYSNISKYLDQSDIPLSPSASTIKHLHYHQEQPLISLRGQWQHWKENKKSPAAAKQTWVTGLMTEALLNTITMKPHHSPESSSGMHWQNACSEGNTALEGRNFQPTASHAKIKEISLLEICRIGWPNS